MVTPSSSMIAEIFLQHNEHSHLVGLSIKLNIVNYFHYINDILVIFDPSHTNIQATLEDFNAIHPKPQFTAEVEVNNTSNYLDISIQRTPTNWKTSIYRKHMFIDTIIPYTSNHPMQHKYAAVKFLYNRLNSYDLHEEEYQHEVNIIHNILYNNSFLINPQKPPCHKPGKQQLITQTPAHRWATFITNIFRWANFKIAFCTNNTNECNKYWIFMVLYI